MRKKSLTLALASILLVLAFGESANRTSLAKALKQIFTYNYPVERSNRLCASGIPGYMVSAGGSSRGFFIHSVDNYGFARNVGMVPGDLLLHVNNRVVASARDADRILTNIPTGTVRAVFVRQGEKALDCYTQATFYNNVPVPIDPSAVEHVVPGAVGRASAANVPVDALEKYMIDLINSDRAKNGQSRLPASASLSKVARAYAQDMCKRGHRGHFDPEGRSPLDRAVAAGISGCLISENLAWRSRGDKATEMVKSCQDAMMAEPADDPTNHRGNILNATHQSVGVGVAYMQDGGLMTVQEFSSTIVP